MREREEEEKRKLLLTTRLLMMIFNPFNLLIQSSEFSLDYGKTTHVW